MTVYQPNPFLVEFFSTLPPDKHAEFGDALADAILAIAETKARAECTKAEWQRVNEPIFDFDYHYPWVVKWKERGHDGYDDRLVAEVTVSIDEIVNGIDVSDVERARDEREAAKAQAAAEKRAAQEAVKASAKAKIIAVGLTLEEQAALGMNAYIVK